MTFEDWWKQANDGADTTDKDSKYPMVKELAQATWDAAQQDMVKQQEEITDMCIVSWVSTEGTLKEKVLRLLNWEVAVALDPLVSSDAQALIAHGKREANKEMAQCLIDGLSDNGREMLFAGKHDDITYNAYLIARDVLENKP